MGEPIGIVDGTVRPVPELSPESEYFWRSGADGVLRILQCHGCQGFIHPFQPMCRYCRSRDLSPAEVSGRGVIVGLTLARHTFDTAFPAPYFIANVALLEDPRVVLMSNISGADADAVEIGMTVTVRFDQHDDVWIPLFDLDGGRQDPFPIDEVSADHHRFARPRVTIDKYEDRAAIVGIGMSRIGRRLMVPALQLTLDACEAALADAGLTWDDIDGLSSWPGNVPVPGFGEGGVLALEEATGVRASWHGGDGAGFGPAGSIVDAARAVAAGAARHVMCFRTVWQSTYAELLNRQGGGNPYGIARSTGRVAGEGAYFQPYGLNSAAQSIAQRASHHFARFGTTRETLGWIAINNRANAALNPRAIYREPMTMDDYLSARMISTPFGLFDCDVPCDAAVAVIVSAVDAARDLRHSPVRIEAIGTQMTERPNFMQSSFAFLPQTLGPAAHLWTRTTLRPEDIKVAELYDGFTFNTLSWIEALGFCGIGEAKDFLDGGRNIARVGGVLPLNTNGGQLSEGRTHGLGYVYEAVEQIRGTAGDRQVPGADAVMVAAGGLTPAACMILTADH